MPEVEASPSPHVHVAPIDQSRSSHSSTSPIAAGKLIGAGVTRVYKLIHTGELEKLLDGGSRRITVASIRVYIERKVADGNSTSTSPRRGPGRPRKRDCLTA